MEFGSTSIFNSKQHCMSICNVQMYLQGASALTPGDAKAFKALLRTLPIESALTNSTPSKATPAHNHSFASGHHGANMNRSVSPLSATGRSNMSSSAMF